jgi:hypothetical protein
MVISAIPAGALQINLTEASDARLDFTITHTGDGRDDAVDLSLLGGTGAIIADENQLDAFLSIEWIRSGRVFRDNPVLHFFGDEPLGATNVGTVQFFYLAHGFRLVYGTPIPPVPDREATLPMVAIAFVSAAAVFRRRVFSS